MRPYHESFYLIEHVRDELRQQAADPSTQESVARWLRTQADNLDAALASSLPRARRSTSTVADYALRGQSPPAAFHATVEALRTNRKDPS